MRSASFWPATFGLACCAIEMMTYGAPRYDSGRWGQEVFRASPRQADLMIVAGRVSQKMAPVLRQIYDQMPNPKWVLAMGVCASTGGMFNNYAIVQGVDHVVPVDMYLPGCPPRPEMLIDAMFKLRDKVRHTPIGLNAIAADEAAEQRQLEAPAAARAEGPAAVTDDAERPEPSSEPRRGSTPSPTPRRRSRARCPRASPRRTRAPRPESQTGLGARRRPATTTEADGDDRAEGAVERSRVRRAEVIETRQGMFGVHGTGDTSGYGGLTRTIEFPAASQPPFGGLVGPGERPDRRAGARSYSRRDHQGRRPPRRDHLPRGPRAPGRRWSSTCATTRTCGSSSAAASPACTTRPTRARELHAVYHLQSMTHNRRIRLEVVAPRRRPAHPLGGADLPDRRLARAGDLRHVRDHLRRPPGADPDPDAGRLARPPAAQGLPARRHPVEYKGATIPPPDQRRSYS